MGELDGPDVRLTALTEEVFTVGGWEAEGWDAFARVSDVHFDPAGNLVVLDGEQNLVVVVGLDGTLLRRISRAGDGPGEFRNAGAIATYDDGRIVVRDFGHRAFLVFDKEAEFVERLADQSGSSHSAVIPSGVRRTLSARARVVSDFLHTFPDGRILVKGPVASRSLDIYDWGGEKASYYTAPELPRADEGTSQAADGVAGLIVRMSAGSAPPIFSPGLWAGVLSDGRVAVVDSVEYRVKLLMPSGAVLQTLARPISPVPVTEEIRDAERHRMATGALQVSFRGAGARARAPGQAEQIRQALLAQVAFADEIPVISGLAVDREDRIWVQRSGRDGVSRGPTDVLTADGGYIGTLSADDFRIPRAFGPAGLMAYVETDEMEAPLVKVVRLLALER